jgi:Domain of unknown function (DUF6398)
MLAMSRAIRSSVPDAVQHRFAAVVALIDDVCRAHLTDEYAALGRELATTLARKRPSPLLQGRAPTWACGITYTLGTVNFLFDPSQAPHVTGRDLCALFGVSQSAGSAKARDIMRLLHIVQLDPRWCLPSKLADNPLVWMIEVNGIVVDVRMMPRKFQQEALRLGLIPFLPAGSSAQ